MSPDASRARRTGPFVQIVASAIWFAEIDGLRSTASSSSTWVSSCELPIELLELLLRVALDRVADLEVLALDRKTHHAPLFGRVRASPSTVYPRTARANVSASTCRAPFRASAEAAAVDRRTGRVDVVDQGNPRRRARGPKGAREVATPLDEGQAALRRGAARRAHDERLDGNAPARPSSSASAPAVWWPRSSVRSDPAGTGRARRRAVARSTSATSSAAGAGEPAQTALLPAGDERAHRRVVDDRRAALANASRRPAHSAQRRTGQATGAPQRSHSGGRTRTTAPRQRAQRSTPNARQTTQRRGSSRSRSIADTCTDENVTCLCRMCAESATATTSGISTPTGAPRQPSCRFRDRRSGARGRAARARERLGIGRRCTPSSVTIAATSAAGRDVERGVARREARRDLRSRRAPRSGCPRRSGSRGRPSSSARRRRAGSRGARRARRAVRADLVRRVAVGGDPIGARHDAVDLARRHQRGRR